MLDFSNDLMDEIINQYVNQHVFHLYEYRIDPRNRNEQIQDEFYCKLERYEYLKEN